MTPHPMAKKNWHGSPAAAPGRSALNPYQGGKDQNRVSTPRNRYRPRTSTHRSQSCSQASRAVLNPGFFPFPPSTFMTTHSPAPRILRRLKMSPENKQTRRAVDVNLRILRPHCASIHSSSKMYPIHFSRCFRLSHEKIKTQEYTRCDTII